MSNHQVDPDWQMGEFLPPVASEDPEPTAARDYFWLAALVGWALFFVALWALAGCSHDARRGSGKPELCFITPKPKWC